MGSTPRVTASVLRVLSALLANGCAERYGMELMQETGLASGTLYPMLVRLERAGWVEAHWEDVDPAAAGRPGRRYYRLTPGGVEVARREIAAMHQVLRATGTPGLAPR